MIFSAMSIPWEVSDHSHCKSYEIMLDHKMAKYKVWRRMKKEKDDDDDDDDEEEEEEEEW